MTTVDYQGSFLNTALFVSEPNKALKCSICCEIMFRPVQCRNGHLYCRGCIDKLLISSSSQNECPSCRIKMKSNDIAINILAAGMIEQLLIRCPSTLDSNEATQEPSQKKSKSNASSTCEWTGAVGTANGHLNTICLQARMNCPHDNCDITPTRQQFAHHLKNCPHRHTECEFCLGSFVHWDLDAHYTQCSQRLVVLDISPRRSQRVSQGNETEGHEKEYSHTSSSTSDLVRDHKELIKQKDDIIASLREELEDAEEQEELIVSLQEELADIKSRPTISHDNMNKYCLLVDRCHCCEDVDAWDELSALADAGDDIALAYTIVVLVSDSGDGTVMCQNIPKAKETMKELMPWLLDEHKDHNVHATYILGYLNYRGMCEGLDDAMDGMKLFQIAASQGHIGAKLWLAFGLFNKLQSKKRHINSSTKARHNDIKKITELLEECMLNGLLEAKYDMANLLVDGAEGSCVSDEKQAVAYYKELAEVNYLAAMVNLGQCYENGTGMRGPNIKLAYDWFKKAADMGDRTAQCNVGVFYCRGSGVKKDKATGRMYLKKAIAQGYEAAKDMLAIIG